jgi:uncharacterized protein (TIGR01777 family)
MNMFTINGGGGQMKIVIPGGSGNIGRFLARKLRAHGFDVTVLSRSGGDSGPVRRWDGRTLGPWAEEIDGSDAVINLAGRSVNCRYSAAHLRQMMDSRVDSTRVVGQAIAAARRPPRVWLQMSTATIYAHRFDADNDEATGQLGGQEPDVPAYWRHSTDIATAWERTLQEAPTPYTRRVALRAAMVMSAEPGSTFALLVRLVRLGLGGSIAGGRQFISWIHERDFLRAIERLLADDRLTGPVNLAAPHPLPQGQFMAELRRACGRRFGLSGTRWMFELAALIHRTETELLLKSRRVVPGRLTATGFRCDFPDWPSAARDLVARYLGKPALATRSPAPGAGR